MQSILCGFFKDAVMELHYSSGTGPAIIKILKNRIFFYSNGYYVDIAFFL